jgi:transcriptional regulator with XRE-family HTH domain
MVRGPAIEDLDISDIQDLIRHAREDLGMSREEFGRAAGVQSKTIQNWENGAKLESHIGFLRAILLRYKIRPRDLRCGTPVPPSPCEVESI